MKHNLSDLVSEWQQFQQELISPVAATNSDLSLPTPSSSRSLTNTTPTYVKHSCNANMQMLLICHVLIDRTHYFKHHCILVSSSSYAVTFDPSLANNSGGDQVIVSKADLDALATEAMMLKEFLPKVLNAEYLSTFSQLSHIEQGWYNKEPNG